MSIIRKWILTVLILILSLPVYAASRYTVFTEVVPHGKKPLSKVTVVTLAGDKGRIDIVERNGRKEKVGLFLMTLDIKHQIFLTHIMKDTLLSSFQQHINKRNCLSISDT